jgi:hypothetical protein
MIEPLAKMIERIAHAIAAEEGDFTRGTVPNRLNNPGDLIFMKQAGAVPHAIKGADGRVRVFCEFATPEDGLQALYKDLRLKAARGLTLRQTIRAWAPASDGNDPKSYLAFVCKQLGGVDPDIKLSTLIGE